MSTYRLSARAASDLESIWQYVAVENENPDAARSLLDLLYRKLTALARNPRMGQLRDDLRPGLRIFPAGRYVILYRSMDDGIEIVGVVHGARDYPSMFHRGER